MNILNPLRRGRVWFYRPDSYEDMPVLYTGKGGDEFGRRTVIVTVRRVGSIIFAYRTCYCVDCAAARVQHETFEYENACAMKLYNLSEEETYDLSFEQLNAAVDAHRTRGLDT